MDHFLSGKSQTDAYIAAGYSPKGARGNASILKSKQVVQDEIDRRQTENRRRLTKTSDDVVMALSKLAFSGMSSFVKVGSTGHPYVTMEDCTKEDLDLLQEITVESYMEGDGEDAQMVKKMKIKLYSRLDALKVMAQYFGLLNGKNANEDMDRMAGLMKEIMERGSTLPVRVTGPLGSKRPQFLKLVNPGVAAE